MSRHRNDFRVRFSGDDSSKKIYSTLERTHIVYPGEHKHIIIGEGEYSNPKDERQPVEEDPSHSRLRQTVDLDNHTADQPSSVPALVRIDPDIIGLNRYISNLRTTISNAIDQDMRFHREELTRALAQLQAMGGITNENRHAPNPSPYSSAENTANPVVPSSGGNTAGYQAQQFAVPIGSISFAEVASSVENNPSGFVAREAQRNRGDVRRGGQGL